MRKQGTLYGRKFALRQGEGGYDEGSELDDVLAFYSRRIVGRRIQAIGHWTRPSGAAVGGSSGSVLEIREPQPSPELAPLSPFLLFWGPPCFPVTRPNGYFLLGS